MNTEKARLIDANALYDKVWDTESRIGYVQVVDLWDIEHAPTIDPRTLPIVQELERTIERQEKEYRQSLENTYKVLEEINKKISEIQHKLESKRNKDDNEHDCTKRNLENDYYGEVCRSCIYSAPVYGSDKVKCLSNGDCFVKTAYRLKFK